MNPILYESIVLSFQNSPPNHPSQYPSWALIFPILLGIAVFAAFQIVMQSAHDFHHALLGFTEALLITLIFTDVTKVVAGRYRPDWWAPPRV